MNPLKQLLILFSIIIFLVTCETKKNNPISTDRIVFQTTDQSELFFKNIRQSSYVLTEMRSEGMNLFYPRAYENETWLIRPYLVHNWRIDKVFLMLELNESLISTMFQIGKEDFRSINYMPQSHQDQAVFAVQIYNSIIQEDSILVYDQTGKLIPVFSSNKLKESFRITSVDFLNLIGILP